MEETREDRVSPHVDRAKRAIKDSKILLSNSGSYQGAIGRAAVAMIHAGWAMLLSAGEHVQTCDDVVPALKGRFGNNSRFYGFITGANDVYLRAEFGTPIEAASLADNARKTVANANEFITMAQGFLETRDQRCWSVI